MARRSQSFLFTPENILKFFFLKVLINFLKVLNIKKINEKEFLFF